MTAFAEGPVLSCEVTREGPRKDGKPGYEMIDQAKINTVIDEQIETTELTDLTVKTYVDGFSTYMLVLIDKKLGVSSSQHGSLGNDDMNLSLDGKGYANFITCIIL